MILQVLEAKSQLLPSESSFFSTPEHSFHHDRKLSGWLGSPGTYFQGNSGNDEYENLPDGTNSWCVWNTNTHGYHVSTQGDCSQAASAAGITYDASSQNSDTLPTGCYYEDQGKHVFWNVCPGQSCKPKEEWILSTGLKAVCLKSTPSQTSVSVLFQELNLLIT